VVPTVAFMNFSEYDLSFFWSQAPEQGIDAGLALVIWHFVELVIDDLVSSGYMLEFLRLGFVRG